MAGKEIIINAEKCIGCGSCVTDCVTSRFELVDGVAALKSDRCIECGHCYAVCPAGAVSMPGYDCSGCEAYLNPAELDADKLLLAMKSRRSVRRFTAEGVSREDFDKIIQAGRYSPTGSNAQNVHFIVLDSVKQEAERLAIKALLKMEFFAQNHKSVPEDYLFKKAPLVILTAEARPDNAGLASSYMELMANALGLGVLYSGYFTAAANNCPELRELIGTPEGMKIISCLVIGHPDVEYYRGVPRKDAKLIIR